MSGDARQAVEDQSRWITETEWTQYIQEDPDCPHLRMRGPSHVSIFRVPKSLKDTKRKVYVPQRVSLGPYHHGSAELPSMGHHKGRALRTMVKRFKVNTMEDTNDMDFANRAMVEIGKLENQIRDRYEENIDCDKETLARMLCLDGCFLLEVLRIIDEDEFSIAEAGKYYDPIFGKNKLFYAAENVQSDLLILENQIPFIVLLKLLQLELKPYVGVQEQLELNADVGVQEKLFELAKGLLSSFIPFDNPFDNLNLDINHHDHLLDFLHAVIASPASNQAERVDKCKCCIQIDWCSSKSKERNDTERIPHVVELRNAGIKFSALLGGCIRQIKFDENSATIFLPPISITDSTERVFRNLIAYEMCKPSEINYVTSYVALMDGLIDSEQDVALLRRMRVLRNWLGSDKEVVDLFDGLAKEVTLYDNPRIFDNLTEKVNAHYNNEIKIQIGKLMHDHFSSPWTALALTGAIVILLLTVLQTVFTIISTYK